MENTDLQTLLQHPHLWRASDAPAARGHHLSNCTSSGYALLDELLHNGHAQGGWPHSSSCELLSHQIGIGELRLLMPGLTQANRENRWIAWIAPPFIPYAPALNNYGINLNKLLIIRSNTLKDSLWAAEQCLQSGACSAVLVWPQGANYKQLRRLQVAAKEGKSWGIFFRPAQDAKQPSPSPLRIRIARKQIAPEQTTFLLKAIKRPGGWASHTLHLSLIDDNDLTQTTTLEVEPSLPEMKTEMEMDIYTQSLQEKTNTSNPKSKGGVYAVDVSPLS